MISICTCAREEGCPLLLGDGVGVEVVRGAGEAGHGVAGGGPQAGLRQVQPGGGQRSLRRPVQRIHLEAELYVAAPRAHHGARGGGAHLHQRDGVCVRISASKSSIRRFVITEKAPTRAFSWLKVATTAFTFKTLLRHYAK